MDWREWATARMINQHGMGETDAQTVLDFMQKGEPPFTSMKDKWSHQVADYPEAIQRMVRIMIHAAITRINTHHPHVWYQNQFEALVGETEQRYRELLPKLESLRGAVIIENTDDDLLLTEDYLRDLGYMRSSLYHWTKGSLVIHDTTSGTEAFHTRLLTKIDGHLFPVELKTREHLRLLTKLLEAVTPVSQTEAEPGK